MINYLELFAFSENFFSFTLYYWYGKSWLVFNYGVYQKVFIINFIIK